MRWGSQLWVGVPESGVPGDNTRCSTLVIKIGIASEVVYEVESVKTQSIPPIPQLLGVKKKNGARANQTGRRFHRWLGGL